MKYLELFNLYSNLEYDLYKYGIKDFTIRNDGSINVNNNVHLKNINLTKIPFNFNYVDGYFDCSINKLTNLIGSPIR